MSIDDFFEDQEEWIDFQDDDEFEEFERSNVFSSILAYFTGLELKFYMGLGVIVFFSIGLYFFNYTNNTQVGAVENKNLKPYLATVIVWAPCSGESGGWGSGTVVSNLGFILTNQHVVSGHEDIECYEDLLIFVSEAPDKDPILMYYANIVASDETLDISILEIVNGIDGASLPNNFYSACVGDSEKINLSDELSIWGYPETRFINLDTPPRIDVSQGYVAGFDAEEGISEKAWITVSSDFTFGSSGGGAFNDKFELVGVTTAFRAGRGNTTIDRGLLRPTKLVLERFKNIYFEQC